MRRIISCATNRLFTGIVFMANTEFIENSSLFTRFVSGQVRLWVCFWIFYVIGLGLLTVLVVFLIIGISGLHYDGGGDEPINLLKLLINCVYGYAVPVTIITWRSASSYEKNKLWPILCKFFMSVFGLYLTFVVLNVNFENF